ncbi:MAG: hypothetical protein H7839_21060 [Magnetococcus sp. YQC-5]
MDYTQARVNMVKSQAVPNLVRDPALLAGLMKVPREEFVHSTRKEVAYADIPIPWNDTGRRSLTPLQTAWMIQALEVKEGHRVLVIGASSGYEVALLRAMGASVYALEVDPDLAARGAMLTGSDQVFWQVGPLNEGWHAEGETQTGRFDAILICGAVPAIPAKALGQLQGHGVMAVIIGQEGDVVMQAVRIRGGGFGMESLFDTVAPVLPGFTSGQAFQL